MELPIPSASSAFNEVASRIDSVLANKRAVLDALSAKFEADPYSLTKGEISHLFSESYHAIEISRSGFEMSKASQEYIAELIKEINRLNLEISVLI